MTNSMLTADINAKVNLVKNIANKTRGPYTPENYGRVIIPMAIIRRFDCILADKNEGICKLLESLSKIKVDESEIEKAVNKQFGVPFYNKKCITLEQLVGDSDNIDSNFLEFIGAYSPSIQEILKGLKFREEVEFMIKKGILFEVVKAFSEVDFHPNTTSPMAMGYIFEEIIRTYKANAEAGDHYTPREVIELCVELMMSENVDSLKKEGKILRVYDGCCGTGGMLTTLKKKQRDPEEGLGINENNIRLYGQDVNPEAYAICCAEMLMLGEDVKNIREGNTLTEDKFPGEKFDLLITNPPFGVEWKTEKTKVEAELKSPNNRFVAGIPRVSDGQLLFLQNLISKAEDDARIAIILNGSPLFSGDAGSGESEIRRYVLENHLLEAIVALPDQMFYNTGIYTYIWILSKKPSPRRNKKVQLINATEFYVPQKPKSLGNKRKFIDDENRKKIVDLYKAFEENEYSKIFDPEDFGYTKVTIDRPLYDEKGEKVIKKGAVQIDPSKRDTEYIPLKQDIDEYIKREVLPYVPDAIPDRSKDKIGYEIPFTRYFYKYTPPRPSKEIMAEIIEYEESISGVLKAVLEDA
jgi:type I restriction enzyme M protein